MPWTASRRGERLRERGKWAVQREKVGFTPPIIELWICHCYWRCKGTRKGCGKKLRPWRRVEVVKTGVLVKWRKVFLAGLSKKMNSSCHEA